MPACEICFRHCQLTGGQRGFCGVREGLSADENPHESFGSRSLNYGRLTALALDPIEKKPLARFYPGSLILSVGSFGCNLSCPFCQNHEISWPSQEVIDRSAYLSPSELAECADRYRGQGNIGVAFTYNEPLVGYEYVRDTARIVRSRGMKNVLVTNGTAGLSVLAEIIPYIDAMNIDLKGFTDSYYRDLLGGNRQMVMDFIREAVLHCHVELTCLIIPGENDSEEEMSRMSAWIAGLKCREGVKGRQIPLHITRFFPQYKLTDRPPTDVGHIYRLADLARENLDFVYTGNC